MAGAVSHMLGIIAQVGAGFGPGGSWTDAFTVTIGAGEVGSDVTDFPVMVRLSDMPAGFWSAVKADGGDIRATDMANVVIPHDLSRFDYTDQDGVLWVKRSITAAGGATFKVICGNPAASKLAVGNSNGRNAVWSDYTAVFLLGETAGDDRTGGTMGAINFDPDFFELIETSSTDLNSHQGVCWDGTYYYTTDDNAIYKWDATWTQVDSNTDPIGDAAVGGSPTVNHLGSPDVKDGRLYIPLECYPASGGLYNAHIVVFDPSDLSFIEAFDIHTQAHEASAVAYCTRDSLLYVTDYDGNNATLYKYDPATGSYIGTLTTDKSIPQRQGVTWWRDHFWISQDTNDETLRVSYAGEVSTGNLSGGSGGIGFGIGTAGNYEGIGHRDNDLMQLIDPGATERVEIWKPYDLALAGGGGLKNNIGSPNGGAVVANGRTSLQTYTLGVTLSIASKGQNRTAVSYWREAAGGTNTRQVIGYRHTDTTLAIWDVNNSWLEASPTINPTLNQSYRVHAVYSGTSFRKIYVDGAEKNSQSTITAVPNTLDTIRMLTEDTDDAEQWSGVIGFVYLRPAALSADWLAAEYSNLNAPGSFYSVS